MNLVQRLRNNDIVLFLLFRFVKQLSKQCLRHCAVSIIFLKESAKSTKILTYHINIHPPEKAHIQKLAKLEIRSPIRGLLFASLMPCLGDGKITHLC